MKYNPDKKRTLNLITLGCSKNLVDSERILGQLPSARFQITHDASGQSDIVVINTCGFINDAKQESIDTILEYVEAKKQGLVKEILVTGCLSQRYKDELSKEIPEADGWFGVIDPHELFDYLSLKFDPDSNNRFITTPSHFAYLKIAEGCDRTCSFCAIPKIRGAYRSRTPESLIEEARKLADKGVKELLLVAQDLTYYGYDFARKSMLNQLLKSLSMVDGIEWIRLHYAYPANFPDDVINEMASNRKICRYIDLPLQHINDNILTAMRRGHDKSSILKLLEKLRRIVPDIALRTTLMVGFPGETRKEFEELLDFIRLVKFDRLGVFTYSPEEGTTAWNLGDTVPDDEKKKRAEELMELQAEISGSINDEKIGKIFKVIIDGREGNYYLGRTEYDSPEVDNEVLVEYEPEIETGTFIPVKITSATEFELFGKYVKE
ncbi:MAG TPA: 30S ribosomal protein S12 methylthiotransferase RimO [Bacteroidales bacterium]|nr:30S ribosomal protein S12 methylthiotransferase RimO [Bacteroidales bacterium]